MSAQACTKGPNAEGAWKTAGRARQMLRITGAKAPWKGEPSNLQLLLMVDGGGSKRSVSARVLKTRLAALFRHELRCAGDGSRLSMFDGGISVKVVGVVRRWRRGKLRDRQWLAPARLLVE